MAYGRTVAAEKNCIAFHAYTSTYMDSWRASMLHAAAEDQVQGLGAIPDSRIMCPRGCSAQLTAYHVSSACLTPEYNTRHDIIVARILRTIFACQGAPDEAMNRCRFTRATATEEYNWSERAVRIRAGVTVKTRNQINHNKPDILIILDNPAEVYVIEFAVSHLLNIRLQEKIKRHRYEHNSMANITRVNVDTVPRDTNLVSELRHVYQCPVELGVLVIGAYGEALNTEEMRKTEDIFEKIGVPRWKLSNLVKSACYSSAVSTTNIYVRRNYAIKTIIYLL